MKKNLFLAAAALCALAFSSCASTSMIEENRDRIDKTYVGMPLSEFQALWPDAKKYGVGFNDPEITIYGIMKGGYLSLTGIYFYIKDDVLIEFGEDRRGL
jgi:ABC-type oligopeptide transport system substrate-binding subunit